MKGTRAVLAIVAAVAITATTTSANQFGVDMYLKGGPGFFVGYQTGRFMPGISLGLSLSTGEEHWTRRDSTGAPDSTWTHEQTHLTVYPEIGTRIYLGSQAARVASSLQKYLWVSGHTSLDLHDYRTDGQPDTERNRADRWSPRGGAQLGFGIEYSLQPGLSVNGEIGLTGTYHTDRSEYDFPYGGRELYDRSYFSLSQYAGLGVSFYFF